MRNSAPTQNLDDRQVESTPASSLIAPRCGRAVRLLAATLSLTVVALVAGNGAPASAHTAAAPAFGGLTVSKVTGQASNGAKFVGRYQVRRFVARHGQVKAVGRLTGTLTKKNGAARHVSKRVRMPLNVPATQAANGPVPGIPVTRAAAQPPVSCEVLNLVLGPLDLNLLGLRRRR